MTACARGPRPGWAAVVLGLMTVLVGGCGWKRAPTAELARHRFPGAVTCLAFSPDGATLAVGTAGPLNGDWWAGEV